jgi:antirestriction protein
MSDDRIDTRDLIDELADQDMDVERREAIAELFAELSNYAGDTPEDGIFLIAERDFEDYARELADDIGAVSSDGGWPTYCIDWAWAARELAIDYTSVEFDGTTYLYR